jgi:hypothetical protein
MSYDLVAKQVGLLHEIKPGSAPLAAFFDPNAGGLDTMANTLRTAASALGREIELVRVSNNSEIDLAFAAITQKRADALLLSPNFLFSSRRGRMISLLRTIACRPSIPSASSPKQADS